MHLLYFMIMILVVLLFFLYYSTGKDIFSPPAIMVIVFIISINFAAINALDWNIEFAWKSFFILITGILSFVVPYIVMFSVWNKKPREYVITNDHDIRIEKWKLILVSVIDVIILVIFKSAINELVSMSKYSGLNTQWAYRILTSYEGGESLSGYIRIMIKFIDASAYTFMFVFINNVLVYKRKFFENIILLIAPTVFIIKTILSGGRQDLLKLLSFTFICAYIQSRNKVGWKKDITLKYIFRGIVIFVAALPAFYYSIVFVGRTTTRTLFVSISTYVGGSIQHFNQYIADPIKKSEYWGNETFVPILNFLGKLGIIDYHNTVHLEFRRLGITIGNVYTFFRRPLQDFGIVGMYIFTMIVSVMFSYAYIYHIRNRSNSIGNNLNTIIYVYLLYWIVLSSVEQYSMSIISIQTILTIIAIVLLWRFLFCVRIKRTCIKISRWEEISKIV